jgi:hypothetical protein
MPSAATELFPTTLGIDDPRVGDELASPTVTYLPTKFGGSEEFDATVNYTKTRLPCRRNFRRGRPDLAAPDGYGWDSLDTELKWNFFCIPNHEVMVRWDSTSIGERRGRERNICRTTPTGRSSTWAKASAISPRASMFRVR